VSGLGHRAYLLEVCDIPRGPLAGAEAMSRAASPFTGRHYGLVRVAARALARVARRFLADSKSWNAPSHSRVCTGLLELIAQRAAITPGVFEVFSRAAAAAQLQIRRPAARPSRLSSAASPVALRAPFGGPKLVLSSCLYAPPRDL